MNIQSQIPKKDSHPTSEHENLSQNMDHNDNMNKLQRTIKSEQQETAQNQSNKLTFSNQMEYWLTCIGYAVGFGNIWRFPYLLYNNGGAIFLIPYSIAIMFIAIPLYMIETSYGQILECKIHHRFSAIHKRFFGFSICQFLICLLAQTYYNTLLGWSIGFFTKSFQDPLPWTQNTGNSKWNSNYFHQTLLQRSQSIDQTGFIVPELLLYSLIGYILIYGTIYRGIKSSGKVVYFTALGPYVMMTILFVKSIQLDGATEGLKFLFFPDWSKLFHIKVWQDAFTQILYSSGVAFGPLIFYGNHRPKNSKVLTSSVIIPLINSLTSLFASVILFAFLGHISKELNIKIDQISQGGLDLAFIAYPGMLSMLQHSQFFSILFFFMLIIIGIDSIFGILDYQIHFLLDSIPWLKNIRHSVFVFIICLIYFLVGIMFSLNNGFWLFQLFDRYSCGLSLIYICLVEIIIITWFMDLDKINSMLFICTHQKIPKLVIKISKYVTPVILLSILVLGIISEVQNNPLKLPEEYLILGRSFLYFPMVLSIILLCYRKSGKNVDQLIQEQYYQDV